MYSVGYATDCAIQPGLCSTLGAQRVEQGEEQGKDCKGRKLGIEEIKKGKDLRR